MYVKHTFTIDKPTVTRLGKLTKHYSRERGTGRVSASEAVRIALREECLRLGLEPAGRRDQPLPITVDDDAVTEVYRDQIV